MPWTPALWLKLLQKTLTSVWKVVAETKKQSSGFGLDCSCSNLPPCCVIRQVQTVRGRAQTEHLTLGYLPCMTPTADPQWPPNQDQNMWHDETPPYLHLMLMRECRKATWEVNQAGPTTTKGTRALKDQRDTADHRAHHSLLVLSHFLLPLHTCCYK